MREEIELKDRRYLLKTYPSCFIASEAVDWALNAFPELYRTRKAAVEMLRRMQDEGYIAHVCNNSKRFKDKHWFFRFVVRLRVRWLASAY